MPSEFGVHPKRPDGLPTWSTAAPAGTTTMLLLRPVYRSSTGRLPNTLAAKPRQF